ncbi:hypothetical protein [Bradyrhizobium lablabi]|uniref:hypothetical protein n=1 Tax=Bradyrhizobium lablabi TaxID=722472 RepID=UPI001BAE3C30|nr:hypothetical protein [Bradyrhizobium lablabi]MBR0697741.1 hypothetical protein [Bradyrhizobium lablabi]
MTDGILKERAKRLGYKLKRRGTTYSLIDNKGEGPSGTIDGIVWWLNVIEHEIAAQVSTACGMPLYTINDQAPKPAEPSPVAEPLEPIVQHETGGWSVRHDVERYPSHAFARAAWLRRHSRHREDTTNG